MVGHSSTNPSSPSWPDAISRFLFAARRFYTPAALALAGALAAGCASPVEFRPAEAAGRFAPWTGAVAVLHDMPPEGSFARIGVVVARGIGLDDADDLVEQLQDEAAVRGADAIVVQAEMKTVNSASGGERKTLAAWAIRRGG